MKQVKVNSPDMSGIWEVISIYNDRDYGMKTAIVSGDGLLVKTDYNSLRKE